MAEFTPNYNLKKPLRSEKYNVDVQNGNMDIIDEQLKLQSDTIGNFSALTTGNFQYSGTWTENGGFLWKIGKIVYFYFTARNGSGTELGTLPNGFRPIATMPTFVFDAFDYSTEKQIPILINPASGKVTFFKSSFTGTNLFGFVSFPTD